MLLGVASMALPPQKPSPTLRDGQLPAQHTAHRTTSSSSASEHVHNLGPLDHKSHTRACCSRCVMLHAHADCAIGPKQLMPQHCAAGYSYSCSSCYRNARAAPAASASVAPAPTRQGCLTRLRWGSCSQHHQSHQILSQCSSSSHSNKK